MITLLQIQTSQELNYLFKTLGIEKPQLLSIKRPCLFLKSSFFTKGLSSLENISSTFNGSFHLMITTRLPTEFKGFSLSPSTEFLNHTSSQEDMRCFMWRRQLTNLTFSFSSSHQVAMFSISCGETFTLFTFIKVITPHSQRFEFR